MRLAARVTKTCLKLAALIAFALLTRGVPARAGALTQHSAPLASTPVLAATASTRPVATLAAAGDSSAAAEADFPARLGSFTTTLLGSLAARTVNVRLAAVAMDGLVLEPGQALSFNATVGARTLERGYQPAPVILHETRQTQLGGGVCQVASTIFVAALLSGLDVAERWRHSSPVDYIATGEDATIAWGAKDLKLRNNLSQRVRLRVRIAGAALSARFEAEEELPAAFELETAERDLPGDADGGATGCEIELFRIRRTPDGSEERELVHRDVIPPARVRAPR